MNSSRVFFQRIRRAFVLVTALLLLLSAWLPAPLQPPADVRRVPNPVKAAWFLVWIQELVSYSSYWIYPVLSLGILFLFLPYLPGVPRVERAFWFPRDQWAVNALTAATFLAIAALTVVAVFFRGENWHLVSPF